MDFNVKQKQPWSCDGHNCQVGKRAGKEKKNVILGRWGGGGVWCGGGRGGTEVSAGGEKSASRTCFLMSANSRS